MQEKKLPNPLNQKIKGVVIFHEALEIDAKVLKFMAFLNCEVLSNNNRRMLIRTTLGNLQSIKKCLIANDEKSALSRELNSYVTKIMIGGRS